MEGTQSNEVYGELIVVGEKRDQEARDKGVASNGLP